MYVHPCVYMDDVCVTQTALRVTNCTNLLSKPMSLLIRRLTTGKELWMVRV